MERKKAHFTLNIFFVFLTKRSDEKKTTKKEPKNPRNDRKQKYINGILISMGKSHQ